MSLSSQNLLDIAEAQCTAIEATGVTWAIPSPFGFRDKSSFWAAYDDAKDTKTEIETSLIDAAWVRYLNFEDVAEEEQDPLEMEAPIRTIFYEITRFTETTTERLDQTVTPDAFNKRIWKQYHEHVANIMELLDEFQGVTPIPALNTFTVAEFVSLTQEEPTESNVPCEFIPSVIGVQTKLLCRVKIQLPC